jgi:GT2 family glycosyltransferase
VAPEPAAPRCSIVIPVHGRAALTRACLETLLDQRPAGTEILVADDWSPDSTAELLRSYGDAIRVIRPEVHSGFGGACNAAAAEATGRQLVFLNNDTLPTEGWLDALLGHAEAHPEAAIVGCKLLWPNNTVQHAGVVFNHRGNAYHVYAGFPAEHPAVNRSRAFQAVTGAAMLVRRTAFHELGGFDRAFVNGWEDIDLCLRAGRVGHEVRCCHESVLYHLEGGTRGHSHDTDHANWRIWRERWSERVRPDDLEHYVADRLLRVEYGPDGVRLEVSPALGTAVTDGGPNELEQALRDRTREGHELLLENLRLRAGDADGASRPGGGRAPRPAIPAGELSSLTVILPVSDHGALAELLPTLMRQGAGIDGFEVLVANSGEALDTRAIDAHEAIRLIEADPSSGRAGALNAGIRAARTELVLLLADDFVPGPNLVAEHLAVHRQHPREHVAALGPALFPEAIRSDPFVRWLEDSGELFGVSFTTHADELGAAFFWAGNVSLKRGFLLAGKLFDERLAEHAWDDYELGRRLFERGMQVIYAPQAVAYHEHRLGFEERRAVMRTAGRAAAIFDSIYPRPHPWHSGTDPSAPTGPLVFAAQVARLRHLLYGREAERAQYWKHSLRHAFVQGYRSQAWARPEKVGVQL